MIYLFFYNTVYLKKNKLTYTGNFHMQIPTVYADIKGFIIQIVCLCKTFFVLKNTSWNSVLKYSDTQTASLPNTDTHIHTLKTHRLLQIWNNDPDDNCIALKVLHETQLHLSRHFYTLIDCVLFRAPRDGLIRIIRKALSHFILTGCRTPWHSIGHTLQRHTHFYSFSNIITY